MSDGELTEDIVATRKFGRVLTRWFGRMRKAYIGLRWMYRISIRMSTTGAVYLLGRWSAVRGNFLQLNGPLDGLGVLISGLLIGAAFVLAFVATFHRRESKWDRLASKLDTASVTFEEVTDDGRSTGLPKIFDESLGRPVVCVDAWRAAAKSRPWKEDYSVFIELRSKDVSFIRKRHVVQRVQALKRAITAFDEYCTLFEKYRQGDGTTVFNDNFFGVRGSYETFRGRAASLREKVDEVIQELSTPSR